MKKWGTLSLLISICVFVLLPNGIPAEESHGSLVISIEGFLNSEGYAMVAVFDSEEAYEKGVPKTAMAKVDVIDQKARIVFDDLKYGTYAVAIFHDQNANGKMDKNFLGIPKESYGHSNNVRGTLGPPAFDKVMFELHNPKKEISIKIE